LRFFRQEYLDLLKEDVHSGPGGNGKAAAPAATT